MEEVINADANTMGTGGIAAVSESTRRAPRRQRKRRAAFLPLRLAHHTPPALLTPTFLPFVHFDKEGEVRFMVFLACLIAQGRFLGIVRLGIVRLGIV